MKYKLFILLGILLCNAANAKTHNNKLPEQWQEKELVHYSSELFANEDMFYKLLANHYVAGDIKDDYWLAEYILSEFNKKEAYEKITNPLRQRKYLRTEIIPQLKSWANKTKGKIKRPEYVLYQMPSKSIGITSIYAKLETWIAYTPHNGLGYMWRGQGFGLDAKHSTEVIGNKKYGFCENRMKLIFPDYFLGNTKVDVSFPEGLRPSSGNIGRKKSCTYIVKSKTEDDAIDVLDALEKGIGIYWVVKMPESSFTTSYENIEKKGQLFKSINTQGKAVVEGLLIKNAEGKVLLAWTPEKNAVSITAGTQVTNKQLPTNQKSQKNDRRLNKITIWDIRAGDQINWNGTTEHVSVVHPNGSKSILVIALKEWSKYKSSKALINHSKQKRPMIFQGKPLKKGLSFSLF